MHVSVVNDQKIWYEGKQAGRYEFNEKAKRTFKPVYLRST